MDATTISILKRIDDLSNYKQNTHSKTNIDYMAAAKRGLHVAMFNWFYSLDYIKKISNIIKNNSCFNFTLDKPCKYSIKKKCEMYCGEFDYYYTSDDSNSICQSCERRKSLLQGLIDELEGSTNAVITPEIIKVKSILNTLQKKIKEYKRVVNH